MSTEPIPGPDPYDDPPPRGRWLAPAMIGLSIGVLLGGAGVFIFMSLAARTRGDNTVVEKLNIQTPLNATAGFENLSPNGLDVTYLGSMGSRPDSGSAVHRRVTLEGRVDSKADVGTMCNLFRTQLEAELGRHGAYVGGGSTSVTATPEMDSYSWSTSYYTRDGRRGQLDGRITVRRGQVDGTIIICEGR